ncbi:hypothetical protein [Flavobacterium sp. 140616W15]|uniref:hypothetical protein n=1 Tax=Flavobacterium sp. 140616W15 TaxID=2478552 RepID=UPI000F0C8C8A|nr:hypothetical protein [Flavobacterium sp. 140616W15]AYN04325.1 hypothetical protein EAG11_09110 [Flavobacterium sp. 140616W15]
MLKSILNLNGVELLSKNQQKNIIGKGQNGPVIQPACAAGDWAPPGATSVTHPNYPCAHTIGEPIGERPRVCAEPGKDSIFPPC